MCQACLGTLLLNNILIVTHIIFKTKSGKFKKQMSPRFAEAIDRAAMRAGKGSSEAYMADWRRDIKNIETDDPQFLVDSEIKELEEIDHVTVPPGVPPVFCCGS